MKYTREKLIDLCERSIVNQSKWSDRDSSSAQIQIGKAWALLSAGCDYDVHEGNLILDVEIRYKGFMNFEIGEGFETEYFYIPNEKGLELAGGKDWY